MGREDRLLSAVTGLLVLLGAVFVALGVARTETVWVAVGGGAFVVAVATAAEP